MKVFSFPWGLNVGTGRRYRYLKIQLPTIHLKLWWWDNPKYDPIEE